MAQWKIICLQCRVGKIPGLGRSSGEGNGNPFQYPCLGNPVDRGSWRVIVHGVTKELDTTLQLNHSHRVGLECTSVQQSDLVTYILKFHLN